uniref:30S ribosomal protein S16 n=1 Tax=Chrysocystis fragilis TaxID=1411660 RepID=A0A7S0XKV9_9STRA|mmetsp:Transcript_17/g.55  ORF Transcript_17/g.55 Transcript_17/m.55 type:complete len:127 (+) Transcript_17:20-400(+)
MLSALRASLSAVVAPRAQQVVARHLVRIRLARHGRKHRPFYRIVVADARSKRDGRHIERVGTYDPIAAKDGVKEVRLNSERIKYWISVGAQPTQRVAWLLGKAQLLPELPRPVPKEEIRRAPNLAA